ncbi:MAG: ATP-binding cassette domain-containing protein [Candidatus Eisenbacteria bacterium]|nr:ATP-binding cassette domain-containing protein [Candidatus Eisenbacteria bacterium]
MSSPVSAALEWRGVSVDFGAFVLHQVDLCAPVGTWLAIVGPTGAGKSLLLEAAAGFLVPTEGEILGHGNSLTQLPPELRGLAYVPQDDLLFPCLDVRENLSFGMREGAQNAASTAGDAISRLAKQLEIDHLLARRTRGLSGGEAQRIALGRALLSGTDTLLLDECTSALDAATKSRVGDLLADWRTRGGRTIVQVTHDSEEARARADTIATLEGGRLVRIVAAR